MAESIDWSVCHLVVLALESGKTDAADDRFLGQDKQNDHWERNNGRGGKYIGPVDGVEIPEEGNPHGDWIFIGVRQHDQGPNKTVPFTQEGKNAQGDHGRLGQRQHNAPIGAKKSGTVNTRGILQFARDIEEELAQEKKAKCRDKAGKHNPQECIGKAQYVGDQKGGNLRHRPR